MKATGIVRPVDNLGRVVIPKELRRQFGWTNHTLLEIYVDGNGNVVIKKNETACGVCGKSNVELHTFNGGHLCVDCMNVAASYLNGVQESEKNSDDC